MSQLSIFGSHRSWEDWGLLGIGAAVMASPAIGPEAMGASALLNTFILGFLVICLAISELMLVEQWETRATLLGGVWLAVSPILFGYAGWIGLGHAVLGGLMICLSILEYWQERSPRNGAV